MLEVREDIVAEKTEKILREVLEKNNVAESVSILLSVVFTVIENYSHNPLASFMLLDSMKHFVEVLTSRKFNAQDMEVIKSIHDNQLLEMKKIKLRPKEKAV